MAKQRVLVLYGSESGTCKRIANTMSNHWKEKQNAKFEIVGVCTGKELIEQTSVVEDDANVMHADFTSLKQKFDVLIVITSSYGDGDPPDNFAPFFLELLNAADVQSLGGMQHAVFGQGSSVYQGTFQNIPRLTDKLLGEAGSRRFLARHETDAAHYADDSQQKRDKDRFRDAVFEALQVLPSTGSPPVCEWREPSAEHEQPKTQITHKTPDDLKEFRASGAVTGAIRER